MLKSLMTVSGFTLLSRILGLVREMLIANYLGAGAKSDAWVAAFRFPNLFRRVLGEGALNAAFVPMYSSKLNDDGTEASNFGSRVIVMLSLILAVICVVSFIFMEGITRVITSGFDEKTILEATYLSRITVGYLFLICIVAAISGILNSHKKFGAPSFAYSFLNIVFLGGIIGFMPFVDNKSEVLAWSLLVGGFVQIGIVLYALKKSEFKFSLKMPKIDSDMKKLGLLMAPGLVAAGVQQFNLLVGQWVASFQEGGMSYIFYSDRVNQLPLGIIGIAFGVVLLPELTKKLKGGNRVEAKESIEFGLTMAMFIAIPAMVGMAVLAEPIMIALFKGGEFTLEKGVLAGYALMAFAIGCPAYIAARVIQAGYFANQDTKTPMKFTMISALVNIIFCFVAWITLGSGLTVMGDKIGMNLQFFEPLHGGNSLHVGCAIATSIAGWVNIYLLCRGLRGQGLLHISPVFWKKFGKMLIASLVMGLVAWFAADLLRDSLYYGFRLLRILILCIVASLGFVSYLLVSHIIGAVSLAEIKKGFRG